MDKYNIAEKANEMMFDYLWPEHHAQHQYKGEYDLDFKFNHDIWEFVGDYKFNNHTINAYDDTKGLILEKTKYDKMLAEGDKALYIRFCTDGVAIMNVHQFNPEKYKQYWNWAWVEKTQEDKSQRQKEYGWYIPSTDKIWHKMYYTSEQKQMRDKIAKWKEEEIKKIEKQAIVKAWELFNQLK